MAPFVCITYHCMFIISIMSQNFEYWSLSLGVYCFILIQTPGSLDMLAKVAIIVSKSVSESKYVESMSDEIVYFPFGATKRPLS